MESLEKVLNEKLQRRKSLNQEIDFFYKRLLDKESFSLKLSDYAFVKYLETIELKPLNEVKYKILSVMERILLIKKIEIPVTFFVIEKNGIGYLLHKDEITDISSVYEKESFKNREKVYTPFVITPHSILRYIERTHILKPIVEIRYDIVNDIDSFFRLHKNVTFDSLIEKFGEQSYDIGLNGVSYTFINKNLITVMVDV